jgi:hypothetical protein
VDHATRRISRSDSALAGCNPIAEDLVDQSIGLVDAPRPDIAPEELQVFRLAAGVETNFVHPSGSSRSPFQTPLLR